jgi:hypothetical protein
VTVKIETPDLSSMDIQPGTIAIIVDASTSESINVFSLTYDRAGIWSGARSVPSLGQSIDLNWTTRDVQTFINHGGCGLLELVTPTDHMAFAASYGATWPKPTYATGGILRGH